MKSICSVFEDIPVKNWDDVFFVVRTLIDSNTCLTSIYKVALEKICSHKSSELISMVEKEWREGCGKSLDSMMGGSVKDLANELRMFTNDIVKDISPASQNEDNLKETIKIGRIKLISNYEGNGLITISSDDFTTHSIEIDKIEYNSRVVYIKFTYLENEPSLFNDHDARYNIAFIKSRDCNFNSIQRILNILKVNPLTEDMIYYAVENYTSVINDVYYAINFTPLLNISNVEFEEIKMCGWEVAHYHDDDFYFIYRRNKVVVEVIYNTETNVGSIMVESKKGIDHALNINVHDLEEIRQDLVNVLILRQN